MCRLVHPPITSVARGLDPRVHPLFAITFWLILMPKKMDARVKPAHDNVMYQQSCKEL